MNDTETAESSATPSSVEDTQKIECIIERETTRPCHTSTTCGGLTTVYSDWVKETGPTQYNSAKASRKDFFSYSNDEHYAYSTPTYVMLDYAIIRWNNNNNFANFGQLTGQKAKAGFKIQNLCIGMKYIFGYDIFQRDANTDDDWKIKDRVRETFIADNYIKEFGEIVEDPKDEFYEDKLTYDGDNPEGYYKRLDSDDRKKNEKSNYDNLGSVSLPSEINKEYELCNIAIIPVIADNDKTCPSWQDGVEQDEEDPNAIDDDSEPMPDGFGEEPVDSYQGE